MSATSVKQTVKLFVSYSNREATLADELLKELEGHFAASGRFQLSLWMDRRNIELGKEWHPTILKARDECDYGLLLLSPAFFSSDYIREHELPQFLSRDVVLPVVLRPWAEDADLRGLEKHHFFRHGGKAFSESRNKAGFVLALYEKITKRVGNS